MKAVVLREPGSIGVDTVPDPAILDPGDAIVQVSATAICGADLFPFHGFTPGFENGTILGHEFAGTVVEVGAGVTRIRIGQRVICTSMTSDGTCAHCRAGRVSQCRARAMFGYSGVYPRLDGGQAELVRVPAADRCLLALDDAISDDAAIFCADILPTGYASVVRGGVGVGDTVVVLGCGPVGLMAVLCAVGVAGRVIAVDGIDHRRELAGRLGAESVDPAAAAELVLSATGGLGADVVI